MMVDAKHIIYLATCMLLSVVLTGGATAASTQSAMIEGGAVEAPWGFIDFCTRNSGDCASSVVKAKKISLSSKRVAELTVVQILVNRQIVYATDRDNHGKEEYWTYAHVRGDCEDYALEKRRHLIAKGWPRSTLLLTAARMESGRKHLVLVVVTDRGDFVLDNRTASPRHWRSMNYRWLARQSRFNEFGWVALSPSGMALDGAEKIISAP